MNRTESVVWLYALRKSLYAERVIWSFRCHDTERLFLGERVVRFVNIESAARRKLGMLHFASELRELLTSPRNRLEPLKGNRIGQHSIRIDDRYRICFRWHDGHANDVEIVDYH
jgi:proteic killer suppression protein